MAPRVLIVDDDPLIHELLQSYLAGEGYEVACASTAEQAEASLAEAEQGGPPFDLVLLDIRLPGKDGLTLTRELRVRSEVGIILITGRNDDIDRILGLECGADDYVIKPPNPRELVSRAKNLIRRVRHARAPAAATPARQPLKRFAQWRLDPDRRRLVDCDGGETLRPLILRFDNWRYAGHRGGRPAANALARALRRHRPLPARPAFRRPP